MAGKAATRNVYGETLAELGSEYPNIVVLDADLSGSTMSKYFAQKFPERFFNCGIAEANMTGIAAGLASCGYKAFTNSFAMFATGRAFEQIRNSVAYPELNVVIVGSHGGISVGEDGATHQCIEDLSLMRSIPNMLVCCPADGYEMRLAVRALVEHQGPAYLRLQRSATDIFTDEIPDYRFELGKGCLLSDGTDLTIIANGLPVLASLQASRLLAQEGISARVINMHTIKPLDTALVVESAQKTGCILTVEEHSVIGGLGSAVCETLSEYCPVPVLRHGIYDQFGRSGSQADLIVYYGLTADVIAQKAREALARKK